MYFFRKWDPDRNGWSAILLDDRLDPFCCLVVPEDTVIDWRCAWQKMAEQSDAQVLYGRLLKGVRDLADCRVSRSDEACLWRVLYGLLEFLQARAGRTLPDWEVAVLAIKHFLESRLTFSQPREGAAYEIQVGILDQAGLKLDVQHLPGQPSPDRVSVEDWLAAFQKKDEVLVGSAIQYYEFLYPAARLQSSDFVLKSFVTFSWALAECLERDDRFQPYRRRLEDIYQVIVCHEDDLNLAREGLLQLLQAQQPPAEKWSKLSSLIHDLKRTQAGPNRATRDSDERLATLAGLVADHYLDRYDVPRSVAVWRLLDIRDLLLKILLGFLQRPGPLLIIYGVAFGVLVGLAKMEQLVWPPCAALQRSIPILSGLLLILLAAGPIVVSLWMVRNLWTGRLYYGQLFLPRLLGAIIVGLMALMLGDTTWRVAIQAPVLVLLLLGIGTYLLSYIYILFDIYETIKFEPWTQRNLGTQVTRQPRTRWPLWFKSQSTSTGTGAKSTLTHAAKVAYRLFAIGVLQSFLVTLFLSGLVLPVIFGNESAEASIPWQTSILGAIEIDFGVLSFVLVPSLVLLWTGMALFIGAFAQLLWQERHVTSPIRE
jgi:hypothetical protein